MSNEVFDLFDFTTEVVTGELQTAILGPSGSGKSHFMGTYPGTTLYLYGDSEQHGIKSAIKNAGENLIPVCWARHKGGDHRSPDASYKFILQCLDNGEVLVEKGVKCVAVDSMVDLLRVIRNTQVFNNSCINTKGNHDRWAEPDAYVDMANEVLNRLRRLTEKHGIDFVVSFDLEIQAQGEKGEILQSKPRLPSFSVAERLIQQFPDVLMIGRVKGKTDTKPMIQMGAGCTRQSHKPADEGGDLVKTIDFTPRIGDVEDIPKYIKPDLAELLKMKGR